MADGADKGIKLKEDKKPPFTQGESHLFVIGINEYDHFPKLYNAVGDAKAVAQVLLDKYQFSSDHFHCLYDEQATQGNILAELDRLSEQVDATDNLLIYFSGHGEYKDRLDIGYWLPVDGDPRNHGSYISFQYLQSYLRAIDSHHTVVIADSCYAGSIFTVRSADEAKNRLESRRSRWLLTAGRNEVVKDGKPGDHSPFAEAVLYNLRHNTEERMRISTLFNTVIENVASNASQTPRGEALHGVGHMGGEFMFRLKEVTGKVYEDNLVVVNSGKNRSNQNDAGGGNMSEPRTPTPPPVAEPDGFADLKALRNHLLLLLASDDFKKTFELLNKVIDDDSSVYNTLILQQGRYNSIQRDINNGLIDDNRARITVNQIRNAMTSYIQGLSESDLEQGALGG
jgi:hypothetical protein